MVVIYEGVQNTSSQNMPLEHTDYFKLKAFGKKQMQEGHSDLLLFYFSSLKARENSHGKNVFFIP